jgi:hypothetical protein
MRLMPPALPEFVAVYGFLYAAFGVQVVRSTRCQGKTLIAPLVPVALASLVNQKVGR